MGKLSQRQTITRLSSKTTNWCSCGHYSVEFPRWYGDTKTCSSACNRKYNRIKTFRRYAAFGPSYLWNFEEAGLPKGVANIVMGSSKEIGETLTDSDDVRKLTFTGSTKVGQTLFKQSAETLKKSRSNLVDMRHLSYLMMQTWMLL